ncbi:hypothetical protein HK405_000135, partial [Cladochytrium tenue]
VTGLNKQLKELTRDRKSHLKEIASSTAAALFARATKLLVAPAPSTEDAAASSDSALAPRVAVVAHHRPDADVDFVANLARALQDGTVTDSTASTASVTVPLSSVFILSGGTGAGACVSVFGLALCENRAEASKAASAAAADAAADAWAKFSGAMGDALRGGGRSGIFRGK